MEAESFPVVATSSSGCAAVLGYADGRQIPRSERMFIIAKIVHSVQVPVTADVEAGCDDLEQTALDVIAAGAVGLNFEDMIGNNLVPLENQLQRLRKLRAVADESGLPLVLSGRPGRIACSCPGYAMRRPSFVW